MAPFDIEEVREITSYDELQLDTLGDQKTVLASLGPELEHPVFAGLPEEKMVEIKELMKNFNTLP